MVYKLIEGELSLESPFILKTWISCGGCIDVCSSGALKMLIAIKSESKEEEDNLPISLVWKEKISMRCRMCFSSYPNTAMIHQFGNEN